MTRFLRSRLLLPIPGIAMAAATVSVSAAHPQVEYSTVLLAGVGVVLFWAAGVLMQWRYPQRPMGMLLFLLAVVSAVNILLATPDPLLGALARLIRPLFEILVIWVLLAFPTGHLRTRRERWVMLSTAASLLLLWLPGVLLSPTVSGMGPLSSCQSDCPANPLMLADLPQVARGLELAFRACGSIILLIATYILLDRLRQATPLMRRALGPVVAASIIRTLNLVALLITGEPWLVQMLTMWLVPLSIMAGVLYSRMYMARALQRMVEGLRSIPDPRHLRQVVARALDDPSLNILYWHEDEASWLDSEQRAYPSSQAMDGRATTLVRSATDRPVAALQHDTALLEEPELIQAVIHGITLALESHQAEVERQASRLQAATAAADERQRIERDLHDGAQQRLFALRMKLSVLNRLLSGGGDNVRKLIDEIDADLAAASVELRQLAHGVMPAVLVEQGLNGALAKAASSAAIPTQTNLQDLPRFASAIEVAVYFCCLEALQNASKHAGSNAQAKLAASYHNGKLCFSVSDNGPGIQSANRAGKGLNNMRERIQALDGHLSIGPGENNLGTLVRGEIPATPRS